MSEQSERTGEDVRPADVARRELLRRGVRLAYVVPAVLVAFQATPALAHRVVSGGTPE